MKQLSIGLFVMLVLGGSAQQLPQYSQYMLNQMAINPAVAGTDDYSEVRSNSRHQWIGITDAPRTYMLTLQGPIKDKNMGLGMGIYTDIVGPTRRTGIHAAYAYQVKIKKDIQLSMALSAGILQWGIDGNKLKLRDDGDQQLLTTYQTALVPDFGAGLYLYQKKKFYFGFSLPQLHQAPIKLYPGAYKNSRIISQFNFNGAYTFEIGDDFKIEPSYLLKFEVPAPLKLDLGTRVIYKDQIWLGGAWRIKDAVSMIVGYIYDDYLTIGYSYDVTTTKLKSYSSATHEVMLGIRFSHKQASAWKSPSNK